MDYLPPRQPYGTLRKSAFGRTNLFLKPSSNALMREIRCAASVSARQASTSIFHAHGGNTSQTKPDNCACWHCCHGFDTEGFRLPRLFDPSDSTFHVYGWFCSANCAKAYILEHSTFDRGYQMNIFVRMLRDVYGISETVNESPPRLSLSMFGGPFDIETFRTQKNVCFTVTPPFVAYCMLIEERQPVSTIGEQTLQMQRGSVRGLRRPTCSEHSPLMDQDDDLRSPPTAGMYDEYLKKHTPPPDSAPPAKKAKGQRVVTKNSGGQAAGLARFAAK